MSNALDDLASGARSILGTALSDDALSMSDKYLKLISKWQKSQRLVGSSDPGWIVENLFLDSLLFLRVLPRRLGSLADLGSGAGFPGVPIKLARPEIDVTLIESRERRVSFLSAVVRELGLDGLRVVSARAEQVAGEKAGAFGAVVMRCAGDFASLLPSAARLVAAGGLVVASGPPNPTPLPLGGWVEVPGVRHDQRRRFAVYRVPGGEGQV